MPVSVQPQKQRAMTPRTRTDKAREKAAEFARLDGPSSRTEKRPTMGTRPTAEPELTLGDHPCKRSPHAAQKSAEGLRARC